MKPNSGSNSYEAFRARWMQRRREALETFNDEHLARLIEVMLDEIEAMRFEELTEIVSLQDAARVSGYHESTISRMLDRGEVQNCGSPGRPRLRIIDLAYKPGYAHPGALRCRVNGDYPPVMVPAPPVKGSASLELVDA